MDHESYPTKILDIQRVTLLRNLLSTFSTPMTADNEGKIVDQTMHAIFGQGDFPTTHWTLVAAAGDRQRPDSRRALETLCEAYWYPLYVYARRRGDSAEEAQDHTQDFFAR